MKLRSHLAPTGFVYVLGLAAAGVAHAAPPEGGDGFAVEEEEEDPPEGAEDDAREEPPADDGDWNFEVEDLSEDEAALEADLKAGEVQAQGQNVGTISGTVLDTNGDPIAGAYIEVVGKKYLARTGIDGTFRLNVPAGTYTLVAREELHEAIEQPGIKVAAKATVTQDFRLKAQGQALVVKVEADANVEGDAGVIKKRQQSVASSDSMSREEISRSGGGSLANVARFIVGATIIDGRFVFVRGLGHRYGNTLLDGARVPSPEPDLRTVPLDIFPSGALGAINVQKSFTPDVPGDFAGGSIQLITREIPTEPTVTIGFDLEANTATTFRPMVTNGGFGAADAFGFGNIPRALPDEIPTEHKAGQGQLDQETFQPLYTPEELERQGEAMYTDTRIRRGARAPMNGSLKATAGDSWSTRRAGRFGLLGSAEYKSQHQTERETVRLYSGNGSTGVLDTAVPQVDYAGMKTTYTVRWSALGLARWDINDDHRVEYSSLYSRDADDETREQRGVALTSVGVEPSLATRIRYVMRSIWFNRLGARHKFPIMNGKHRVQLDYFGSYSQAKRDDPAMRSMLFYADPDECPLDDIEAACPGRINLVTKGGVLGDQLFLGLVDDNLNGALNLEIPFDQWSGLTTSLKFGGWAEGKWRNFGVRRFDYKLAPGFGADDAPDGTGNILNNGTIGGYESMATGGTQQFALRETTRASDNYRAKQQLYAFYGMATLPLVKWFRVSGGARVEASDIEVEPFDLFADPDAAPADCASTPSAPECLSARLTNLDVLPALAFIFSPKLKEGLGDMNIRLMGSKTLARPEFRELAPFQFTDFVGGFTVQGNEDLQETKIWNAEVRWEWFPRPTEVVAVTGFFKYFDSPIEQVINANTPPIASFINADYATNVGAELELKKSLGFVAKKGTKARDVMDDFALGSNFAYVYSRVHLLPPCYPPGGMPPVGPDDPSFGDYVERDGCKPAIDDVTSRERPLQGQSPYVLNVFVDYDNDRSGSFARVMFNTFGPRIYAVSAQGIPNIYEVAVPALDLLYSQRLFGIRRSRDGELRHELRLNLEAKNLLNPAPGRIQGANDDVAYDVRKGASFSAGLSWAL